MSIQEVIARWVIQSLPYQPLQLIWQQQRHGLIT
jgi:hypothetical protein